jgi:hypothetical protein
MNESPAYDWYMLHRIYGSSVIPVSLIVCYRAEGVAGIRAATVHNILNEREDH